MMMDAPQPGSPLFPALPVALGDYKLTHLLGVQALSDAYVARQSHVERRVVLEVLRPAVEGEDAGERVAGFMAMARARVAAPLAQVSPVLESSTTAEGYCYISQPLPEGVALSAMAAEGRQLTVQQACALVEAASRLYGDCAGAGLAAAPLQPERVFMTRAGEFHFLSPVLEGSPAEGDTARQLRGLAEAMLPVRPAGVAGQGRVATLLQWMQEGYEGEPLDWAAAANTAGLIAEQLKPAEPVLQLNRPKRYDRGRELRAGKRRRREGRRRSLLLGLAAAVVILMGAAGVYLAPEAVEPIPALRGGCVHCKVEGKEGARLVRVAARPVSIAEYRMYLEAFPALDASRKGSMTQNVPPTESDPTPAGWEAQLAAANADAPVTNVSYWQALMYARWQRAALPSATLLAAARAEAGLPGVEEWTDDELPATLPYAKARTVLPAEAEASPIPEMNPAARSVLRGFRICP